MRPGAPRGEKSEHDEQPEVLTTVSGTLTAEVHGYRLARRTAARPPWAEAHGKRCP
jgi:hypothetical protein